MKTLLTILALVLALGRGHAQTNYACTITGANGTFTFGIGPSITVCSNYIVSGSGIADGTYVYTGGHWIIPGSPYNPTLSQDGFHWTITGSFGSPVCTGSLYPFSAPPETTQTWTGSGWTEAGGVLPWTPIRTVGVDVVTFTSTNAAGAWQAIGTNHFDIPVAQPQQFFRSVLTITPPQ